MPTPRTRRSFLSALVPALPGAPAQAAGDEATAAFAESVELAVVAAYEVALDFVSNDLLPLAELHLAHHREHAGTFAALAGDRATGEPNAALLDSFAPGLDGIGGTGSALRFVASLEDRLAATHAALVGRLERGDVATAAATIAPVESAHAAATRYTIGDPLDAAFPTGSFEPTDPAAGVDPAAFPTTQEPGA